MDKQTEPVLYLSPKEVSAIIPGNPTDDSIRNWMREGVRVKVDGQTTRLRMKHLPIGGRIVTTIEWVNEFLATQRAFRDQANGFGSQETR